MLTILNSILDIIESSQGAVFAVLVICTLVLAMVYIRNFPHAELVEHAYSTEPEQPEERGTQELYAPRNEFFTADLYTLPPSEHDAEQPKPHSNAA